VSVGASQKSDARMPASDAPTDKPVVNDGNDQKQPIFVTYLSNKPEIGKYCLAIFC